MSWFSFGSKEQADKEPKQASSRLMLEHNNAAGGRLYPFSEGVGYHRDGYCRVTDEDGGNHSIAATVNQPFLDFTQSKGNNLTQAGVKDGMKWCLCASRWKEAFEAYQQGKLSKDAVPQVHLHASDAKALDVVAYGDLSKFKAEGEATSHRSRNQGHIDPGTSPNAAVREGEMSGDKGEGVHQGLAANKKTGLGSKGTG